MHSFHSYRIEALLRPVTHVWLHGISEPIKILLKDIDTFLRNRPVENSVDSPLACSAQKQSQLCAVLKSFDQKLRHMEKFSGVIVLEKIDRKLHTRHRTANPSPGKSGFAYAIILWGTHSFIVWSNDMMNSLSVSSTHLPKLQQWDACSATAETCLEIGGFKLCNTTAGGYDIVAYEGREMLLQML